jgi:hypothetical protein
VLLSVTGSCVSSAENDADYEDEGGEDDRCEDE